MQTRTITVPMADAPLTSYAGRRIDVTVTPSQALVLQQLRFGLMHSVERTSDGKEIKDIPEVIRWLIDKIEAAEPVVAKAEKAKGGKRAARTAS